MNDNRHELFTSSIKIDTLWIKWRSPEMWLIHNKKMLISNTFLRYFPSSLIHTVIYNNVFIWDILTVYDIYGLYSLSGWATSRKILWSLETARLDVLRIVSLRNLTAISAALLPRSLERLEKSKPQSRGFETLQGHTVRRPSAKRIDAEASAHLRFYLTKMDPIILCSIRC